jgi:hypothetical protein
MWVKIIIKVLISLFIIIVWAIYPIKIVIPILKVVLMLKFMKKSNVTDQDLKII